MNWVDPALPEVQDYLLALVGKVAQMGVDEIQLDYIRFPTQGDMGEAVFAFNPAFVTRDQVISRFVGRVRQALEGTGVLLSADIFGVIPWGRLADQQSTGQNLATLLPLLDVVSPMLYPSHFYGPFGKMERLVDYPYYLVYEGCRKITAMAAARPWLQAFSYGVEGFEAGYVCDRANLRRRRERGAGLVAVEYARALPGGAGGDAALGRWGGGEVDSAAVRRRFPALLEEASGGGSGAILPTD